MIRLRSSRGRENRDGILIEKIVGQEHFRVGYVRLIRRERHCSPIKRGRWTKLLATFVQLPENHDFPDMPKHRSQPVLTPMKRRRKQIHVS